MNGSGTVNRSRLTPNPPGAHDASSHNAALKGASLAFQKSTPRQIPPTAPSSRNVDHGALLAATSAASASASRDQSRAVSRNTTGNSIRGGVSLEAEQGITSQILTQRLQPPSPRTPGASSRPGLANKQTAADPRSPSFIAATLAASRSASPIRNQIAQSNPHTQESFKRQGKQSVSANNSAASSIKSLDLATDTTSIPSTNALISMFEKRGDEDTDPVKKGTVGSDSGNSIEVKPKPRPLSPPRAMSPIVKNELSPAKLSTLTTRRKTASRSVSVGDTAQKKPPQNQNVAVESKNRLPAPPPTRTKSQVYTSTQPRALEPKGKLRASTPPPKSVSQADTVIISPRPRRSAPQKILLNDIRVQDSITQGQTSPPRKLKPKSPASAHDTRKPSFLENEVHRNSVSSDDSFVSASSGPSPNAGSPQRGRSRPSSPDTVRPRRPQSAMTISTTATAISTRRAPPLPRRQLQRNPSSLPLESLTDAIMAGSLASSRITPSTAKDPPPKPPSRKQTPHMRQTLRQPPSKSDDEGNHSRAKSRHRKPLGKLGGGNKHAHHEGARKRWREEITARERKRYEGVWASNRGLLLVPTNPSSSTLSLNPSPNNINNNNLSEKEKEKEQVVANIIVRDIWARSRLPFDELAEVWDLVDRRGRGFLDREEFVVGMWLVDQRLRGRKIPRKVTESVWGSARGVRVAALRHGKK